MTRSMTECGDSDRRLWWGLVGAIALAGLLLRAAASQGGLWTDEAWSMVYAEQARDPLGVFLRINHDNNHHLNSLWLQLVGIDAPHWLARLPAMLAGSASILLAAMVLGKRSKPAGLVAALLFAFSPIMLTYGSEARGYAPMMLATLITLLLVMQTPEKAARATPWLLGLVSLLGMLSHMTMMAPVTLVTLWVYADRRSMEGPAKGLRTTARLMGPALAAAAGVLVLVVVAAAMSPTGMGVGGYQPFSWKDLWRALGDLSASTFGLNALPAWLPLAGVVVVTASIALRPPAWLGTRSRLYAIMILGVPLAAALIRPGNIGFARYFLCSSIGLLLLASEWIGHNFQGGSAARIAATATLGTVLLASLWQDTLLIHAERGNPDEIIILMHQRSPGGSRVALETPRLEAVVKVAATHARYRVDLVRDCAPVDFVVSAELGRLASPGAISHCGVAMRPIGSRRGTALSGDSWILYSAEVSAPAQSRH